jgi:hypothetical protein
MKQLVDQMVEYSVVLCDGAHLTLEQVELRELYDELVTSSRPASRRKGSRYAPLSIRRCPASPPIVSG